VAEFRVYWRSGNSQTIFSSAQSIDAFKAEQWGIDVDLVGNGTTVERYEGGAVVEVQAPPVVVEVPVVEELAPVEAPIEEEGQNG
jgi:hypothetical protein